MAVLTCNACNKEFDADKQQKLHYWSEWHRNNLKRKIAGVPGVTEALFEARQSALAEERSKLRTTPMSNSCALCGKEYRSAKAHAQHLNSRTHVTRASQESAHPVAGITIIKPLSARAPKSRVEVEDEESEDEWMEVDPNDDLDMGPESDAEKSDAMDEDEEVDTSCYFVCDVKYETTENCIVHMHK